MRACTLGPTRPIENGTATRSAIFGLFASEHYVIRRERAHIPASYFLGQPSPSFSIRVNRKLHCKYVTATVGTTMWFTV